MTIEFKLSKLSSNPTKIFLFKEGDFVQLYNINLCWFTRVIKMLNVHVKYIKETKQIIYYGGFPETNMGDLMFQLKANGYEVKETKNYYVILNIDLPAFEYYEHWMLSNWQGDSPSLKS